VLAVAVLAMAVAISADIGLASRDLASHGETTGAGGGR
jgi:hypothetical protein